MDLRFEPEIVGFEEFFDYGCPIKLNADGEPEEVEIIITESRIEMPVFKVSSDDDNPKPKPAEQGGGQPDTR